MCGESEQGAHARGHQSLEPSHNRRMVALATQCVMRRRRPFDAHLNKTWPPDRQFPSHGLIDQGAVAQDGKAELLA